MDGFISLFTDLNWAFVLMYVILLAAAFALAFNEPSFPGQRREQHASPVRRRQPHS